MSKAVIKVEQTRSPIRRHDSQRETLIGLGLNKIGRIAEVPDTPSSRGMIAKVQHLVRVHEPPEVSEIECLAEQVRAASSEGGVKTEAMTDAKFIRTRFQWLDLLAEKSPVVARLDLKRGESDEIYEAEGEKVGENKDAFNFANSEHDNVVIVQTIDRLSERGAPDRTIRKLVLDLTGRRKSNTYGTFCELSAYSFLLKGIHDFDIQASMTGADILNPNGSDLDGRLRLPEVVFFDAKAFGFNEHLVNLLTERLSAEFDPEIVEAHESWDVPVALLVDLLGKDYRQLKDELTSNRQAKHGTIRFVLRPPAKVRMTFREIDLALLAQENPDYAFRYAKQFARQKPFFLFFVIHPWLSGSLHQNFIGSVDTFTRSFAYRTFTHFRADHRAVFDITMGEASRLLSGIVFINAWTGQPPPPPPQYRCFLNPFAKNKPAQSSIQTFIAPYGEAMAIVEFESDVPTDRSA